MQPFKDFLAADTDAVIIKTSYQIEIKRLQEFFKTKVKPWKKEYQGGKTWHGGWSVQSNSGEVHDGWQPGGSLIKKNDRGQWSIDPEARKEMFPLGQEFKTPTALCEGITEELLLELGSTGFDCKRTRFAELEPGGIDRWHRDSTRRPTWRGHIAVQTNPNCHFWWSSADRKTVMKRHIPADGHLYMVRVDLLHRITNHGTTDRVHILVDPAGGLSECRLWVEPLAFLKE